MASRHIDDPRVWPDPSEGVSAGTQWFELFGLLRILPIADRPTLYTIQADLVAAVYAVGLGRIPKAAVLLSEAITVSVDAGLHRLAYNHDVFGPIEVMICIHLGQTTLGTLWQAVDNTSTGLRYWGARHHRRLSLSLTGGS